MKNIITFIILLSTLFLQSCRKDELIYLSDSSTVTIPQPENNVKGFYLLNEGNMGMNSATIDKFDYQMGVYTRDVYSENNPNIVKELGDVGNDIKIYGSKVYATINVSNLVEVFDLHSGKHIKAIHVPNCRYLAFKEGKAYVSSYSGKVAIDPNAEIGFVAEIDTLSLEVTRKVEVGHQPEEMVIHNNKLYVANSGGYRVPAYDTTVSVVDLNNFTLLKNIEVAINLHRMRKDMDGDIYVSSRGDYGKTPSSLYIIDSQADTVKQHLKIPISNMTINEDKLYFFGTPYTHEAGQGKVNYGILNTKTKEIISTHLIQDGTEKNILIPYGLAVNPETKEIFITDAQDYVGTGYIYCFTPNGQLKWRTLGGNIPAHFAFIY